MNSYQPPPGKINLANQMIGVRSLGPGYRSVIWVQGCPFSCPGCISPEWIPFRAANLVDIDILANSLLANPEITGLTISGGEPFEQAESLSKLIEKMRRVRQIDVICFTGYKIEMLQSIKTNVSKLELLSSIDLLIDGPYIQGLNNGIGLRGSTNQRFHHITDRLKSFDFTKTMRSVEFVIHNDYIEFAGIPAPRIDEIINSITIL
jgi:anaerobic ribonucleoside-triphosphate reductase activating protein